MEDTNTTPRKRSHADFQNAYRRSSNFSNFLKKDNQKLLISGNGALKLKDYDNDVIREDEFRVRRLE